MSLINDALKEARKVPPQIASQSSAPIQPVYASSPSGIARLLPVLVILLLVAALFFIGWAMMHRSHPATSPVVVAPDPQVAAAKAPAVEIPKPVPATPVTVVSTPAPAPRINPPDAPRLQGIFYSPAAPSAILDGTIVHPGDQFQQYRVKQITQSAVVLINANGQAIQLGMNN